MRCVAVVADEPRDGEPRAPELEIVRAGDLAIPRYRELAFGYEREALTYAITPDAVAHVLAGDDVDAALFIKQESLVVGGLGAILHGLDQQSVVLTPHLLEALEGQDAAQRELMISCAGIYNAGVIGVRADDCGRSFTAWWASRVRDDCVIDPAAGLHYEQRWLDLVPALFGNVGVVRDPGANVGHWNMRERRVSLSGDRVTVNGGPGAVIRFSGYEPERPDAVTKYTRRPGMGELHGAADVFARYRELLIDAGYDEASHAPYAYARFADGTVIPPLARELYRAGRRDGRWAGDPFAGGPGSFREWVATPCGTGAPVVSRFWHEVWLRRKDLQSEFPDHLGADRPRFTEWIRAFGRSEHEAPDEL